MRKAIVPLIMLILTIFSVTAAMDPNLKECMQRGYEIQGYTPHHPTHEEGTFCVFPDGSECRMDEFNAGTCGVKFKTEDYCVPEGKPVWDKDRCCPGTIAYLKPYHFGQATCQSISLTERAYNQLNYNFYIKILLLLVVIAVLVFFAYKFLKKKIRQ